MGTEREVIKSSLLQQKVCRTSGTLLRKKKVFYEEAEWVALCVHDKRIPFLEWYIREEFEEDHRPQRIVDLLDAAFVNPVISDPRSFTIGFVHSSTELLELSALTANDCQDWVHKTTTTLIRLNCFGDSSNIYSALPEVSPFLATTSNVQDSNHCTSDADVPQIMAPVLPNKNDISAVYERLSVTPVPPQTMIPVITTESQPQANVKKQSCDHPPPLPARRTNSVTPVTPPHRIANSTYDFPKNFVPSTLEDSSGMLKPFSESEADERLVSPIPSEISHDYGRIRDSSTTLSTEIAAPPDSAKLALAKRGYSVPKPSCALFLPDHHLQEHLPAYDTLRAPQHRYDFPVFTEKAPKFASSSSQKVARTQSSTIAPSGLISKSERRSIDCLSGSNKSFMSNLDLTLEQYIKQPVRIALQLKICQNHVAFIDFDNRVWVAGWSRTAENHLSNMIHIGDELTHVMEAKTENVNHVFALLRKVTLPTMPVDLTLRQVPYGKEYTFTKDSRVYDFGIVFRKHKNKIQSVREGSPAYKAGIRAEMPACTHPGTTGASIVQLNGRQLSLFSKNDEFLSKLMEVPLFTKFTVVVLPYDFVKMIKKNFKKFKNFD